MFVIARIAFYNYIFLNISSVTVSKLSFIYISIQNYLREHERNALAALEMDAPKYGNGYCKQRLCVGKLRELLFHLPGHY